MKEHSIYPIIEQEKDHFDVEEIGITSQISNLVRYMVGSLSLSILSLGTSCLLESLLKSFLAAAKT